MGCFISKKPRGWTHYGSDTGLARGQACSLNRARLMSPGIGATIKAEFAGGQIEAEFAGYGATTVRPLYPSFPAAAPADLWGKP